MSNESPDDFPAFARAVRKRHAEGRADAGPHPEYPFCLQDGDGRRYDAMAQARGTLKGLFAILLGIAAAITAIFTFGVVLWVLAGLFVISLLLWLLHDRTLRRLGEEWRRQAEAYPAALVMVNSSAMQPGRSIVPGSMLVDFGDRPDVERLERAAHRVFELTEQEHVPAAHAPLRDWLVTEMQRARFGRLHLPASLAGSDDCWLVSLRFDRNMMPQGFVDRSLWFVAARRDRDESCEIAPSRYWAGETG
ncbi:MAG: hypothetical protein H6838_07850 [Planctomycetes bacterium]|nr:hypothetical protein [Planctomycetota bacterium]MCB9885390.1 hypothetical protein [Planctomycetota bacterium]